MEAIILKAVDTFFFRDHRPMDIGEDNRANEIFPPRPGTVYGALRSAYIHRHASFQEFGAATNPQIKDWMGTPKEVGKFSLRAVWLYDGKQPLLPLPLDYQVVKDGDNKTAYPLQLRKEQEEAEGWGSDETAWRLYGTQEQKSESSLGAVVPLVEWKTQLMEHKPVAVTPLSDLIEKEPKIGIARHETSLRAREHMLYRMSMLRFKHEADTGAEGGLFVLLDSTPSFNEVPFVQLGGESRPWYIDHQRTTSFTLLSAQEEQSIAKRIKATGIARLIFLTPAIFAKGDRPSGFHEQTGELTLAADLRVKLLTAAIGRPLVVGGWDMARHRPKERVHAIPAGSVFYVEVKPEQAERLLEVANQMKLTDQLAHEGYGYFVCAACGEPITD